MYCEECNQKPASVHLTKIVNNKKTEISLCEDCAKNHHNFGGLESNFSIHKFLSSLLDYETSGNMVGLQRADALNCKHCGLSYGDFTQGGRLGCDKCYQDFHQGLRPLLRKIHGRTKHQGKIPTRAGSSIKLKRDIEKLRVELKGHVAREEFEQAAKLRDQIKELQKKIEQGG
ncbi:protein arginine kinase activator [Desulfitispora alkaliphila]|uniref:UvrB/UvrC motif-containing protein n=1 Tax=Desulfitispora alkaliphila TaxID=622674 RepID=UPI003D24FD4B